MSQSIAVISEGVHSFLDLVSAGVAFITIPEAGKPADQEHPYGHGKIETLSSLVESLMLLAAAGLIIFESVNRIRHPHFVQYEGLAIVTMGISLVLSYLMYRHNLKASFETESSALHINALHFLTDVVAAMGVLVGLVLIQWTHWTMIDPIIGFGVALYIILIAIEQVKVATRDLVDRNLPDEEIKTIQLVLDRYGNRFLGTHDLRTRRSGANRHIDFHMVVCGQLSVSDSHRICDQIEEELYQVFPQASIHIHVEPCENETPDCKTLCQHKEMNRKMKK